MSHEYQTIGNGLKIELNMLTMKELLRVYAQHE